jgi:endoglucanase
MSWGATELLGRLSLATVASDADSALRDAARGRVIAAADTFVANVGRQGYRTPFDPGAGGQYPWGSNSSVLNATIVMGLAYDVTNDRRYLDGVVAGMDYILDRNALDKAYVTAYGARPLENPHHRFWAHQLDRDYPPPPPGAVSGGPNSGLQDPYAQAAGLNGCAPQKCYVDNIESWSTNEITINWNAPLAWAAAFLDEHGR